MGINETLYRNGTGLRNLFIGITKTNTGFNFKFFENLCCFSISKRGYNNNLWRLHDIAEMTGPVSYKDFVLNGIYAISAIALGTFAVENLYREYDSPAVAAGSISVSR